MKGLTYLSHITFAAMAFLLSTTAGCDSDSGGGCTEEGRTYCGGECVDTSSDKKHCGECGNECAEGQVCRSGRCADESCVDDCGSGEKRCDPGLTNRYQVCGDLHGNGCLQWGPLMECDAGLVCSGGECTADTCVDDCGPAGSLRCADPPLVGLEVCSDYDADACLEWGGFTPCADGETCISETCTTGCVDDCFPPDLRVCDDVLNGYKVCGLFDEDDCFEWSVVHECDSAESCSGGECVEECIEPDEDCENYNDCCDYPEQNYHCCPVFKFCVEDFWD